MPGRGQAGTPGHRSVSDSDLLDKTLPKIDAVMHLAGYIEVGESQSTLGCISPTTSVRRW